jgi:hypothetical protein
MFESKGSLSFMGLIVSACADPAATCAGYGFKQGTVEYANCQMTVNEQNRAAAGNFAAATSNMGVMSQPMATSTTTSCRRHSGGVTCNTF